MRDYRVHYSDTGTATHRDPYLLIEAQDSDQAEDIFIDTASRWFRDALRFGLLNQPRFQRLSLPIWDERGDGMEILVMLADPVVDYSLGIQPRSLGKCVNNQIDTLDQMVESELLSDLRPQGLGDA
jgi:hypothetical protein